MEGRNMKGRIAHILLDRLRQRKSFAAATRLCRLPLEYAGRHCSRNEACANLLAESACAPPLKKHRRNSRKFWASPYATWGGSWKDRNWSALCSSSIANLTAKASRNFVRRAISLTSGDVPQVNPSLGFLFTWPAPSWRAWKKK